MGYIAANVIKQIAINVRNNIPSPSISLYDCYDFSNHVKDICFECVFWVGFILIGNHMIIDDDTFRLVEIVSPCWLQLGLLVLLLQLLVLSTPSLVSWTLDVIVHTVLGITDVHSTPSFVSWTLAWCCPHRPWYHGRLCGAPDVAVNLRDAFVLIMIVNI